MLKSREFYEVYDGVMRTFKKRVAVLLDKESTLNLISISAYVFRQKQTPERMAGLTLTELEAKKLTSSLLKS